MEPATDRRTNINTGQLVQDLAKILRLLGRNPDNLKDNYDLFDKVRLLYKSVAEIQNTTIQHTEWLSNFRLLHQGMLDYPEILYHNWPTWESSPESAASKLVLAHQEQYVLTADPSQQYSQFLVSLVRVLVNSLWAVKCIYEAFCANKQFSLEGIETAPNMVKDSKLNLKKLLLGETKGLNCSEVEKQIGRQIIKQAADLQHCYDLFDELVDLYQNSAVLGFMKNSAARTMFRLPLSANKPDCGRSYFGIHDLAHIKRPEIELKVTVYEFQPPEPLGRGFQTWTIGNLEAVEVRIWQKAIQGFTINEVIKKVADKIGRDDTDDCTFFYLDSQLVSTTTGNPSSKGRAVLLQRSQSEILTARIQKDRT